MRETIKIENLTKNFGDTTAVDDISITINQGEIFGMLGPNGAGKTTTIKLLTGLLQPDRGIIKIKGISMADNPQKAKQKFALLPDVPYVYKKLTGWEFMKFMTRIYRMDDENMDEIIDRELLRFSIKDVSHDLVESYSHGLKQRLLLASVMVRSPDIIILDEPMVGLDPEAARMVKNLFKELTEKDTTIFLSTHTLADAEELCDRIAIINKGTIIARGTIEELRKIASGKQGAGDSLEDIYLSITRDE
ncbi:MAG: ABC transporter ATP-binding protein [Elusimicrobiota bacterium]